MLSQVLEEMRKSVEPISGNDRSALEGMLEELVKQGKLCKVRQMTLKACQQEIEDGG